MKKLLKSLLLLGMAALTSLSLAACSSTPTPEDIFEKFESDNAKVVIKTEIGGLMTTETVIETDGNKCKTTKSAAIMGQDTGDAVLYTEKKGDKLYTYAAGEDGQYSRIERDAEDADGEESEVEEMKALFDAAHYEAFDSGEGQYVMKEGVEVELDGMTVSNALLTVGDGVYSLTAEISYEGMTGELSMTVGEFGKVKVELPDVE